MFSTYYTRDGQAVRIVGVSEVWREKTFSGYTSEGHSVEWDYKGRYKFNQLFGDKLPHDLDLVTFETEVNNNPGIYFMEMKK